MAHLEESKLNKIVFKKGDFELHLEKESPVRRSPQPEPAPAPAETPRKAEPAMSRAEEPAGLFVTSPMVGTYYASPSPDQPHFIKVGDQVTENTVVCIIEAMKVLNEVKAGVKGTVAEILTDNAQPVEFGTRLLRVV